MEFRRKRALESPPGLLSLLESDHNRAKRPFLDLSEPRQILRRFSSTSNSLLASVKKKKKKVTIEQSWDEIRQSPIREQSVSCRGIEGVSWRKNILFPSGIKSSTLEMSSFTSSSPLQSSSLSFASPVPSTLTSRQQEEKLSEQRQESGEYYSMKEYSKITRPGPWALSRPLSHCALPLTLSNVHSSETRSSLLASEQSSLCVRPFTLSRMHLSMQTEKKGLSSSSVIMPLSTSKIHSSVLTERRPSSCVTPLTTSKMHVSMLPDRESSCVMPLAVPKIYSLMQTDTTPSSERTMPVISSNIHSSMHLEIHNITQSQEVPAWKKLLNTARARDRTIGGIESEIRLKESLLKNFQETRAALELEKLTITKPLEEKETVAFECLTEEEEEEVHQALNGANRHQVLVQHERSNIDLTRATLQCLKPGAWLNDDVINLYLELLKERELRDPGTSMKCHFFNTFFYNKLFKDAHSYDYKSVRRWTTLKKLGYSLLDCDKIFVPIHQDIHWCLAVINMQEKKIQYLDSLGGHDENVLHVLARYLKDEAKDKLNQDFDPNSWKLDCPKDIPAQLNGCDCGMFMIKYADFYSHGNDLKFSQEDMQYFRKRTVLELLQLRAR